MDLTTELDALLEGSGGGQLEYNIYDLVLPVSVLSQLHDGNATFELTLAPPGLESNNDATPNNGAGIDLQRLVLKQARQVVVAEVVEVILFRSLHL